jgi:hypothetical protein
MSQDTPSSPPLREPPINARDLAIAAISRWWNSETQGDPLLEDVITEAIEATLASSRPLSDTPDSHIYCPGCDAVRPLVRDFLPAALDEHAATDLMCSECRCIIATIHHHAVQLSDPPAPAAVPVESRIQRGLEAGALLGPEWDGASLVELAREIVRLRAALASSGAASPASLSAYTESDLRAAWEAGFRLCRSYGDNHAHWRDEQRERCWLTYRFSRELVERENPPDPPAASVGDPQTERE